MSNLTTEQTWELLEIHKYLTNTDEHKKAIGVSLLVDFIETYLFSAKVIPWVSCVKCGCAIQKEIAEEELYMCVDCSNAFYTHEDEKGDN
jgi:hypothetical protein